MTPSVAVPGDTHPSDATAKSYKQIGGMAKLYGSRSTAAKETHI